jgi:hypothetical protein
MDTAEGSKSQIPNTRSQKGLNTDYADSTDEKQNSFIIRAIRVIRGLITLCRTREICLGFGTWDLGFLSTAIGISREKLKEDPITSIL